MTYSQKCVIKKSQFLIRVEIDCTLKSSLADSDREQGNKNGRPGN